MADDQQQQQQQSQQRPPGDGTQNQPGKDGNQDQGTRDQSGRNGTLYSQAGLDDPGSKGSETWPDKWREQMAAGDEKKLKLLQRYDSPSKWADAHFGLVQRIGSGEFKSSAQKPSGADVKPEAVAAWRKEQGLPVEMTEIKVPLAAGMKAEDLTEAGKAQVEHFTKAFFDGDLTQSQIDLVMGRYNEYAEKLANDQAVADGKQRDGLEDHLRSEWGGEYRSNLAMTERFMKKAFGEDGADAIMGARTMDGQRLFNIPEVFKAIHALARANGVDDAEGGEPVSGGKTVDARIAEINNILQTDRARYFKEGLDKEKESLLARKEAAGAR